ncbi:Esterase [Lachnellula hyalina]|uniref:Esterase n=1 Tax=Lachnellula hyalina TaxID=1316788 RepID=A0A8H8RB72_9HELO|nr:Esterase [Lachnellula hyalina]TVY30978.1 Esterase [Lachnellula hyalina]
MAPTPAYRDGLSVDNADLPTIICLHGGGTNSTIFNIQSVRIQRALRDSFHFIFPDGPFPYGPGPDVLPFFEGCEPFLGWTNRGDAGPMPDESIQVIKKAIAERQNISDVVGIMGFSQGARTAAGLLYEQQLRDKGGEGEGLGVDFKFGVLCMGTSPPLTDKLSENELIAVPSIHVVGTSDPWAFSSRELYEGFFDKKTSKKIELDLGHRLPSVEEDTYKIVHEIRRLYRETS